MSIKITEKIIRSRASDQSFTRGQTYYRNGSINNTVKRGSLLQADCEGSQYSPYRIEVGFHVDGSIDYATCTCEYDFGGDCKHIVALLLTFAHHPEVFTERPTIEDELKQRTADELIALVRQMVRRYPDLQLLIDRPVVGGNQPDKTTRKSPVNTESYRKEMQYALQNYEGWSDEGPEAAVVSITENAEEFARAGDWQTAATIYLTVLDEGLQEDYFMIDENGDFSGALSEMLPELVTCLEHLADDADYRKSILYGLVDAILWDIEQGGRGLADTIEDDVILAYARPDDLPEIRRKIETVRDDKAKSAYADWAVKYCEDLLSKLDALEGVNPEVILERLREKGLYVLLVRQLLDLKRIDEALAVIREHLKLHHELLQVIGLLNNAGASESAIQLVTQALQKQYDSHLVHWLLDYYRERGDQEAHLHWQLTRLYNEPFGNHLEDTRQAAQQAGQWQTVRLEILRQMEKQRRFDMLINIYMLEADWDTAWETVERLPEQDKRWSYMADRLDLEVAQKTYSHYPQKALPIFLTHAASEIEKGNREHYQQAAQHLTIIRELYRHLDDTGKWMQLIAEIKEKYKKRPALQDELKKAKL